MTGRPRRAGSRWRMQVDDTAGRRYEVTSNPKATAGHLSQPPVIYEATTVDEIVIDRWFHLEQMDTGRYWMAVAGLHINVQVDRDGRPTDVLVEMVDDQPGVRYRIDANDLTPEENDQ